MKYWCAFDTALSVFWNGVKISPGERGYTTKHHSCVEFEVLLRDAASAPGTCFQCVFCPQNMNLGVTKDPNVLTNCKYETCLKTLFGGCLLLQHRDSGMTGAKKTREQKTSHVRQKDSAQGHGWRAFVANNRGTHEWTQDANCTKTS